MSSKKIFLGSKHVRLPGQSWTEYNKLRNEWYKLAQESGLVDIEYFDANGHGQATPFFSKGGPNGGHGGSSHTLAKSFTKETLDYYRLCGIFLNHADWNALFGKKAAVYKYIFELHSEGVEYRAIARATHCTSWPFPDDAKHSVFWAHWCITKKVLPQMWFWHRQDPEGLNQYVPTED